MGKRSSCAVVSFEAIGTNGAEHPRIFDRSTRDEVSYEIKDLKISERRRNFKYG